MRRLGEWLLVRLIQLHGLWNSEKLAPYRLGIVFSVVFLLIVAYGTARL